MFYLYKLFTRNRANSVTKLTRSLKRLYCLASWPIWKAAERLLYNFGKERDVKSFIICFRCFDSMIVFEKATDHLPLSHQQNKEHGELQASFLAHPQYIFRLDQNYSPLSIAVKRTPKISPLIFSVIFN